MIKKIKKSIVKARLENVIRRKEERAIEEVAATTSTKAKNSLLS